MAVPIAELFVAIGADISGAVSGLNQLDARLRNSTSLLSRAAPAGRALALAGGAITAGFTDAVRVGADFEKSMSAVNAQLNPREMEQFRQPLEGLARSLGRETKFSAREAAQSLEELLKLGIPVEDVLGGVAKGALDLAVATGTDVANAGAIAASAMNAFGLSTKDIPDIMQVLAGVSVTTAADMNDIRLALSDVGASAGAVGLSFRDTATAIGIFRQAGLTGNTAGTALKTMLVGLQPQTQREIKLFKELGLTAADGSSIFFDQAGNIKNLTQIAGILRQKFGGLTRAQRLFNFQMIFGTQGMQAANALFEQGADGVQHFLGEIGAIDPAITAQERINNLAGDLEKLRSAFNEIQIQISKAFNPTLRTLAQTITKALDVVIDWNPQMKKLGFTTVAAAGALALMVGGFVLLAPFLAALPAAFAVLIALLTAVSPLLIGIGIAAKILKDRWDANTDGMRDSLIAAFKDPTPHVEDFITMIGQIIYHIEEMGRKVDASTQPLRDNANAIKDVVQKIKEAEEPIKALAEVMRSLTDKANDTSGAIIPVGAGAAGAAGGFLGFAGAAGLAGGAANLMAAALPALRVLFGALGGPVGIAVAVLAGLTAAFIAAYTTNEEFRQRVDGLIASLKPITDLLGLLLDPVVDLATTGAGKFASFIASFDPLIAAAGPLGAVSEALQKVGDVLGYMGDRLGPAMQPLSDAFAAALPGITSALGDFGRVLNNEFIAAGEQMGPLLNSLGSLFGAFGSLIGVIAEKGAQGLKFLFDNVLVPGAADLARALAELVPFIEPFIRLLTTIADRTDLAGLLANTAREFEAVATAIRNMSAALKDAQLPDWLTRFLFSDVGAIGEFIQGPQHVAPGVRTMGFPGEPQQGGPTITIGTVNIGSEVDADNFLNRMAQLIAGAAGRAEPPVESQTPGMVPQPVSP